MNWISGTIIGICLVVCSGCGIPASGDEAAGKRYEIHYEIELHPADASATVSATLRQSRQLLREMSFSVDARIGDVSGDGIVSLTDGVVRWQPETTGGVLRWRVAIPSLRSETGYDAWIEADWGLFRAEDLIPRARTRTLKDAVSDTSMSFILPPGWSVVTEYSALRDPLRISRPDRRFSQPTGWIAAGLLGVRRDTIAGTRVAIAGPQGHAVRRMDMLALLNWTLPEIEALLGDTPDRLTIVSADGPMWRGGLSAPASLFIHADRPLISENATSTLLHETLHVALGIKAADDQDWIIEGLAEYYSLELLHRGGAITTRRYRRALEEQAEWALDAGPLCVPSSTGATTALAVTVMRELDEEIRASTAGKASLDNVVSRLRNTEQPVSIAALIAETSRLSGSEPQALKMDNLPGCRSIAALWTDNTTSN